MPPSPDCWDAEFIEKRGFGGRVSVTLPDAVWSVYVVYQKWTPEMRFTHSSSQQLIVSRGWFHFFVPSVLIRYSLPKTRKSQKLSRPAIA